jgi:hypothetical protein
MFSLRLRLTIWNFYTFDTELEKNIDASRTNFVDKLLSGAINNTSRSLARNFGAEQLLEKDKACTAIR